MSLWLASGSPRRRELLEAVGWSVQVRPPDVDETRRPGEAPVLFALRMAAEKVATAPAGRLALAADTIVHVDDMLLGKPVDRDEARDHLKRLSGGWHEVTTGVAVGRDHRELFAVTTRVRFRELGEREIERYLATGEADDKAGAYGIQGAAGVFVAELHGSWTNVMGLPVEPVLARLGAP